MSDNHQYRSWNKPDLDKLHRLFLEGDELVELVHKLHRTPEDIIRALTRLDLLIIKEGYYRRMHPTPFAETKAHRSKSEALSTENTA